MQTHGGTAAANEIEKVGGVRHFRHELLVDWNRDGQFDHPLSDLSNLVEETALDRSLVGSAPSEIMLIEGYSAAELSATLVGEQSGLSVVALFSTYNGLSPLYTMDQEGCEVTYRIGVDTVIGTIWYPQFVGNVRYTSPDRGSGTVAFRALDRAEKMRQPVNLPVWATASWQAARGYRRAQLCSSHWVIDQCLRTADASPTPYRWITPEEASVLGLDTKWGMQFWLSGNGAYIPNVGILDNARVQGFPKPEVGGAIMYTRFGEAHPDAKAEVELTGRQPYTLSPTTTDATGIVPALQPADSNSDALKSYYLAYRAVDPYNADLDRNGTHRMGFTLLTRGYADWWQTANTVPLEIYIGGNRTARIRFLDGQCRAECWDWINDVADIVTGWIDIPVGAQAIQIEAQFTTMFSPTERRMGIRAGANTTGLVSFSAYPFGVVPTDPRASIISVRHQVAMQDVYWSIKFVGSSSMPESNFGLYARRAAKYSAILDEGLNKLTLMPQASYEDAWALASSVASAEMGAIFWTETGVFKFWNRDTIAALQESAVRTITLDHVEDLGITNSLDSVRGIVTVDALYATADMTTIFSSDDVEQFYVGATTDIAIKVPNSGDIQSVSPGKVLRYSTVANGHGVPIWSDSVINGYVAQFYISGAWAEHNELVSGVDIEPFSDGQGNTVVRVWNGYPYPVRFSKLRVLGTQVSRQDNSITQFRDQASVDKYGPRNWPLSGDWVQDQPTTITRLGEFSLARSARPIPTAQDIPIPGDPRLQLGDCIDARDPSGMGELLRLQILGYRRVVSRKTGATDHLAVELIRPAGVGLWDSVQYGRWDTTFIWSA